ncbi:DnaD domain protein [uncultured Ruminococcus sp.]|uniref:DnaD domain-containing protein n=1 Tax=uncultured Ruminococcus sp. TaxID=165186 RepID=UPI0025E78017|nr:DnaD domain protein [uncultured Ruminococcus sp.]
MDFQLQCGAWNQMFPVPNAVADHFLKLASPDALRVLLYLLRHGNESLSDKAIADALSISQEQVEDALLFWKQANILERTDAAAAPEHAEQPAQAPVAPAPQPSPEAPRPFAQRTSAGFLPTPSELAARIEASAEIRSLFELAEQQFHRMLTPTEQRSLLWMRDYLGLGSDVILMLIGYCISIEKPHVRYIESVAVSWHEQDILTLQRAQEEVQRLTAQRTFTTDIMRAFEMKRRPTPNQQAFIDQWQSKGYGLELITCAYETCVESIDKLSFSYINKVLATWESEGLSSRAAVNDAKAKRSSGTESHSYQLNEYKKLMNNF